MESHFSQWTSYLIGKKRSHSTRLKIRRPGVEQVFFIHDGGGWDCGSHKYKALRIQVWPKKGIGIIVGPRDVLTINPTLGKGRRIRKALRTKTKQKTQPVHIKGIYFIRVNHGSSWIYSLKSTKILIIFYIVPPKGSFFHKIFQESQSRWSMHWRWSPGLG